MPCNPLTDEQIWGVPEKNSKELSVKDDLCHLKKIKCPAWDNKSGCQAEVCILEID